MVKNSCTDTILGSSKIVFLAYPISIASSCVVVVLEKCTHGCFFFALGESGEDTRTQLRYFIDLFKGTKRVGEVVERFSECAAHF